MLFYCNHLYRSIGLDTSFIYFFIYRTISEFNCSSRRSITADRRIKYVDKLKVVGHANLRSFLITTHRISRRQSGDAFAFINLNIAVSSSWRCVADSAKEQRQIAATDFRCPVIYSPWDPGTLRTSLLSKFSDSPKRGSSSDLGTVVWSVRENNSSTLLIPIAPLAVLFLTINVE